MPTLESVGNYRLPVQEETANIRQAGLEIRARKSRCGPITQMNAVEFLALLATKTDSDVVQEIIVDGVCANIAQEEHFKLKRAVAHRFSTNARNVVVVGSAKLGFSIAPNKAMRAFSDQSDIDVAVVSSQLFDQMWLDAFKFKASGAYWRDCERFFRKLSEGWIRPDLMPRNAAFPLRSSWFDFFAGFQIETSHGAMSPKAGIYKDWYYLEEYQRTSVAKLRGI